MKTYLYIDGEKMLVDADYTYGILTEEKSDTKVCDAIGEKLTDLMQSDADFCKKMEENEKDAKKCQFLCESLTTTNIDDTLCAAFTIKMHYDGNKTDVIMWYVRTIEDEEMLVDHLAWTGSKQVEVSLYDLNICGSTEFSTLRNVGEFGDLSKEGEYVEDIIYNALQETALWVNV